MTSKVATEFQSIGNRQIFEVLISERHYLPFGDEARELVFTGIAERAQLDTADLGSDGRCEMRYLGARGEQLRERGIGVLAMLIMLEGLQGRISFHMFSQGFSQPWRLLLTFCHSMLANSLDIWPGAAFRFPSIRHPL